MKRIFKLFLILSVVLLTTLKIKVNGLESNLEPNSDNLEEVEEVNNGIKDLNTEIEEVIVYIVSGLMSLGVSGTVILGLLKMLTSKVNDSKKQLEKSAELLHEAFNQIELVLEKLCENSLENESIKNALLDFNKKEELKNQKLIQLADSMIGSETKDEKENI